MANRQAVLVTGGAGYIGSHICKALHQHNYLPVALDNLSKGHRQAVQWGPLEACSIGDQDRIEEILSRYQPISVIHCAALADVAESMANPSRYYWENVQGSLVLFQALLKKKIHTLIFSSSCSTYGLVKQVPIFENQPQWPINPYGWSKLMIERVLVDYQRAYGMRYAFLRYFNAAGADPDGDIGESHNPETHLIPLVFQAALGIIPHFTLFGDQHPTPDGTPIRDFIHVSDLAEAHVKALEKTLQNNTCLTLNLGSGTGHSVKQVISAAERICGRKIPMQVHPPRPGDPPILIADITQAKEQLNWSPAQSSLELTLGTAWNWLSKKINV